MALIVQSPGGCLRRRSGLIKQICFNKPQQFQLGKEPEKQQLFVAHGARKKGSKRTPTWWVTWLRQGHGRSANRRARSPLCLHSHIVGGEFSGSGLGPKDKKSQLGWLPSSYSRPLGALAAAQASGAISRSVSLLHVTTSVYIVNSELFLYLRGGSSPPPPPPPGLSIVALFSRGPVPIWECCELLCRTRFAVGRCYGLPSVTWLFWLVMLSSGGLGCLTMSAYGQFGYSYPSASQVRPTIPPIINKQITWKTTVIKGPIVPIEYNKQIKTIVFEKGTLWRPTDRTQFFFSLSGATVKTFLKPDVSPEERSRQMGATVCDPSH